MAIKTSTFSGWRLSGKDAEAFEKQIKNSKPNPFAKAAIKRGEKYAKEYLKNGYLVVDLQNIKK